MNGSSVCMNAASSDFQAPGLVKIADDESQLIKHSFRKESTDETLCQTALRMQNANPTNVLAKV